MTKTQITQSQKSERRSRNGESKRSASSCQKFCVLRSAFCLLLVFAPACAPYRIGASTLYPADVRTVYVPMITSGSYRRNMGERLTEAVMKEIELKTPYKVVSTPNADSILSAQLLSDTKRLLIESPTDEAREVGLDLQVQVTWIDRQGNMLQPSQAIPIPTSLVAIGQGSDVVPEVGQSIATGHQAAIQRLAEQIVSLMEAPW